MSDTEADDATARLIDQLAELIYADGQLGWAESYIAARVVVMAGWRPGDDEGSTP